MKVVGGPKGAVLSPAEDAVMRHTFRATMLRCADIVDRITEADVLEMQAEMLSKGVPLEKVARIDRASLAAAHIRTCVQESEDRERKTATKVEGRAGGKNA